MAALLTFSRKIFHHKHIHYHVQFFRTSAAAIDAKQTRLYGFSHLKTPQGFQRFVDDAIVRSGELINYISSMPSSVEVIRAMDEISDTVCSVVDSAELCRNTHPDREFVKQANMASMRMDEYLHMQDKAFSKEVPQFIAFVLGGPGSGKGTQCSKIVETYGFTHLSAGDLLRNEISCSSKNGSMILELVKEGKIVPSEVTVKLIQKAIRSGEKHKYLIDGFPRTEENRLAYERIIGAPPNLVLFFDCPEEEMVKRVLNRNEINAVGTEDDIFEQVRSIFSVYEEMSFVSDVGSHDSDEGPRKCFCGIPVALVTSWTEDNPGRRFEACKFYNPNTNFRGCKFFRWFDRPQCDWQRDVINKLVREKKLLNYELKWIKEERKKMLGEMHNLMVDRPNVGVDVGVAVTQPNRCSTMACLLIFGISCIIAIGFKFM